MTLQLPEQVHCADVDGPTAVLSTAGRQIYGVQLDNNPPQVTKIAMKNAPEAGEHRCISIFQNQTGETAGFAFGNLGGQVGVNYVKSIDFTSVFVYKCYIYIDVCGAFIHIFPFILYRITYFAMDRTL